MDIITGIEQHVHRSPHAVRPATLAAMTDRQACFAKRQIQRPDTDKAPDLVATINALSPAIGRQIGPAAL